MTVDTLIVNAQIVNEGQVKSQDVAIKQGRIAQVGDNLAHLDAKETVNAEGLLLIPGMIDDQVHFRDPGLTHKGDLATESAAAVAGGITSFMDMPNTSPQTITREALRAKYEHAKGRAQANYAFYLGATNSNIEEIKALQPGEACGVKAFLGASTGNMLVDDPEALEKIFAHCPTLITTHCEDSPMIKANEVAFKEKYGEEMPFHYHADIRSTEACYASSSMAVGLAKKHNTRLHVLHLTTEKELSLFTAGPVKDKRISVEACVHHLFFNAKDYAEKKALIKCNPAIKTEQDQKALQKAINDDVIDVIATDHAPHTWDEKQGNYWKTPAGLPLVQHALVSLLEHVHNGIFDITTVVKKTSHAVADCYGIQERGYIREGYWADLALVNMNSPWTVSKDNVLAKCGWSPFEGYQFRSKIERVWVNGGMGAEKLDIG